MRRVPVIFSVIASVGYSAPSEQLEVEFQSGAVYEYMNVPRNVHESFMGAESLGHFFNTKVRNTYPCRRRQ